MELIEGQTLYQYMKERFRKTVIEEEKVASVIRQIFQALDYLHFNNIIHWDLKPGMMSNMIDE